MIQLIIAILLFGLPLVFFPFGPSFFEVPKVILAEILIELLFLLAILNGFKKVSLSKKYIIPFVILFGLTVIDLVIFPKNYTFLGNPFRLQGVLLFWHLFAFSILVVKSKIPPKFGILACLTLIGLVISAHFVGTELNGRYVGTLAEPNALAAAAIFLWPFNFFLSSKLNKFRIISILSFLLTIFLIFISGSRSGIVALGIQLIFIFFYKFIKLDLKKSLIICLILYLVSYGLPFLQDRKEGFEDRVEVWQTALYAGTSSPIIGHGFGNVEYALKDSAYLLKNTIRFEYVDSSHNIFLDFWVEGGILGLGALILLIVFASLNFIKQNKKLELTLLIGLIICMSFNPMSVVALVAFWWLIGQGLKNS